LIPLYKEPEKVETILKSIQSFYYPKWKLDVKIIIENDDCDLIYRLFSIMIIPSYIQVIVVPFSLPRTKPKALNYAMTYAQGEFVVVYDAEDIPAHDQLLLAVNTFRALPKKYVCLQAKLNFYNADENLLTKLFSIEYSIWFNYLLKGLEVTNLPIPLGGTSNHFRIDTLRDIGMWDAYNVTEDADLGIRLYMSGYQVKVIDSITLEESPINVNNWLQQRSRWIKGFIQTILVFMFCTYKKRNMNSAQIYSTYIFIGLSSYNFYCLPWLIAIILLNTNILISALWVINSVISFVYVYGTVFHVLIHERTVKTKFSLLEYIALMFYPFYFVLHTVACYKAIWEIVTKPFKWNKTKHGESKYK
jgi:cellulose synthase/poly-beta-1,6-N-acetylglucosamine synthase-like glycosyltransferase